MTSLKRCWVGTDSLETTRLPIEWYRGVSGAVIDFRGCVRNENEGQAVDGMEYDGFVPLAQKSLESIRGDILAEFTGIEDVMIYHRIGALKLGETSLIVGVASPHRKEGFAACQKIIDEIKRLTPIWKKEFYVGQEAAWLKGTSLRNQES